MVTQVNYRIEVNNKDVTAQLKPYLAAIQLTDNNKDEADELILSLSAKFKRPEYKDEIKLYLGYGDTLEFMGLYHIYSTTIRNNKELTINASGVNYESNIKQRAIASFDLPISELVANVAQKNGLKAKVSTAFTGIKHVIQNNESDLALIQKVASQENAIFNIKNDTLYFVQEKEEVPKVTLTLQDCIDSELKWSNISKFNSVKATYQDTKLNSPVTVNLGTKEPTLSITGQWFTKEDAQQEAKTALERANQAQAQGTITIAGQRVFAGSILELDNNEYQISKVTHSINKAWKTTIEFNAPKE